MSRRVGSYGQLSESRSRSDSLVSSGDDNHHIGNFFCVREHQKLTPLPYVPIYVRSLSPLPTNASPIRKVVQTLQRVPKQFRIYVNDSRNPKAPKPLERGKSNGPRLRAMPLAATAPCKTFSFSPLVLYRAVPQLVRRAALRVRHQMYSINPASRS